MVGNSGLPSMFLDHAVVVAVVVVVPDVCCYREGAHLLFFRSRPTVPRPEMFSLTRSVKGLHFFGPNVSGGLSSSSVELSVTCLSV